MSELISNEIKLNDDYPLISVVIATYNGAKFIRQQMDSIIEQTYPNIEIIIVDDNSTDETILILETYTKQYPNISIYKSESNLGYVKNFERGFKRAKGNFIAPSDQDDIWHKDKLRILFENIDNYEIVYCNSALMDENGNLTGKNLSDIKRLMSFDNPLMYAIGNTAAGHAMLIRKSTIQNCYPFPTLVPHDYWLGFVATFNSKLNFIDIPLVYYRQHQTNVFGVKSKGVKRKKRNINKQNKLDLIRTRMQLQFEKCPVELKEKKVFQQLNESYKSFTLANNFKRMFLFFKYRKEILSYKRKSNFRKFIFCFKMFVKIA